MGKCFKWPHASPCMMAGRQQMLLCPFSMSECPHLLVYCIAVNNRFLLAIFKGTGNGL